VLPILESVLFFTKHEKELASNSKNLQEQTLHFKKSLMKLSFKVPVYVKSSFVFSLLLLPYMTTFKNGQNQVMLNREKSDVLPPKVLLVR